MTKDQKAREAAFDYESEQKGKLFTPKKPALIKAFVAGAKWQRSQGDWVSVEERFPYPEHENDDDYRVLVYSVDYCFGRDEGSFAIYFASRFTEEYHSDEDTDAKLFKYWKRLDEPLCYPKPKQS